MAQINVLPLSTYPMGTRNIGPVNIADGVSKATFAFQRCTTATPTVWPDVATKLAFTLEYSIDDGLNWTLGPALTAEGGIAFNRDGSEAQYTYVIGGLPAGTNRKIRATITISGTDLFTSVDALVV